MNRDQVRGKAKDIAGKFQRKVGEATGSTSQQVKGAAKQVEGKVQKGWATPARPCATAKGRRARSRTRTGAARLGAHFQLPLLGTRLEFSLSGLWSSLPSSAWVDDYAPSMGAALAYYTVFSLAPLLLIVIAVAGVAFGQDAVRGEIVNDSRTDGRGERKRRAGALEERLFAEGGIDIIGRRGRASDSGRHDRIRELQSALDRIWRVPAPKKASGS